MNRYFKFVSGLTLTVFLAIGAWAESPVHVQQAYDIGSCSGCDLSSAYLKGLQAKSGDFSSASLQGANLSYSVLQVASLVGADLTGADLRGADLFLADLSGANLAGVITDENTTCPDGGAGPCSF